MWEVGVGIFASYFQGGIEILSENHGWPLVHEHISALWLARVRVSTWPSVQWCNGKAVAHYTPTTTSTPLG